MLGTPVEIVPYDPTWPESYSNIEAELRSLLYGMVQSIDHVGSTAVPSLAAKPYIDIDVVLTDVAHIGRSRILLETSGYESRGSRYGDGIWAFMIREPFPGQRVYLCPPGNTTHGKRICFRDILRQNSCLAKAYANLKQELAAKHYRDGDRYTQAKTHFIENTLKDFRR